jgi:hypothetical protein
MVFAGTTGNGIFASANNGTNWFMVNNGLTNLNVRSIRKSGTLLYAGTAGGVFVSADNGQTWASINNGLADTNVISLAVGDGILFALMRRYEIGSRVYATIDSGRHWNSGCTFDFIGSGSTVVTAFTANGHKALIGSYMYSKMVNYYKGISYSKDNGISFQSANAGLPPNLCVNDFVNRGTSTFAGTDAGIFVSNNVDSNWLALNLNLPPAPTSSMNYNPGFIQHCTINKTYLFAALSEGSVWRLPLPEAAVHSLRTNAFDQFTYKLTYPSCSNPTITLSLPSPYPGYTTAMMYNLSGQEIKHGMTIHQGSASYDIAWNTRNFAKGLYTLKIQTGSHCIVERIPVTH